MAFPLMTTRELQSVLDRESRWPKMHRNLEHEASIAAEIERRQNKSA